MNCRFCNHPLTNTFVDLNSSPPSNSFLTAKQLNEGETYYPLLLHVCEQCFLVQIDEYEKADSIFNEDYVYFSSYSSSWLKHCEQYCNMISKRLGLNESSLVVEIASNDGYLLQYFHKNNIPVLGIEPTKGTADVAISKGVRTEVEFFGEQTATKLSAKYGKADLLIGNNVLAHVPNINDFVKGLKIELKSDGVITMEFPHLLKLIEECQFDTVYHEHFSYLSFTTVEKIFAAQGLTLFDVEEIPTHGGSLRIYGQHQEYTTSRAITSNVATLKEKEKQFGLTDINSYKEFQQRVNQVKYRFLEFVIQQKKSGKKIAAYGAAAKGNTFLNYCGVKADLIDFVVDISPYKQGKFLPGCHIPVVNEEKLKAEKPDFIIILPWNIKAEIMEQLSYVKDWGAKFVTAIPELRILN
jgi:2-polyprenyl-3-methyl-5-hydroxy-6-metoxy-1,4-benzoquinol methylase